MGLGHPWTDEDRQNYARQVRARNADILKTQRSICQDIIIEVLTVIQEKVIRPGPKPEERQCFDVANELTLLEPELSEIIRRHIFKEDVRVRAKVHTDKKIDYFQS